MSQRRLQTENQNITERDQERRKKMSAHLLTEDLQQLEQEEVSPLRRRYQ